MLLFAATCFLLAKKHETKKENVNTKLSFQKSEMQCSGRAVKVFGVKK
jgi:hypothetical protein